MYDLGALVGSFSTSATAVNNQGQIVGSGNTTAGQFVVRSFLWRVTLRQPTPEEAITSLVSAVQTLVNQGALSAGEANGLLAKLDGATRHLNRGNTTAAANLLQAFINQVEAFVSAGILPSTAGEKLISSARNAMAEAP